MTKGHGILRNRKCRELFERINKARRCKTCRDERSDFEIEDKKGHTWYSNLLPGFSSSRVRIPIDLLIVAEAIGGSREEDFQPQRSLDSNIRYLSDHYVCNRLDNFHQQQMRELLDCLSNRNITWVFTDLIKCFVWTGAKDNVKTAIEHCGKYLDEQISLLRPRKVLALGKRVAREYFELKKTDLQHGKVVPSRRAEIAALPVVWSYFPSRNTADLWVKNGEWRPIIRQVFKPA